jgi:DNA polymerase III sliding clamp (beta) subunit (PCNA family)
MDLVLYPSQKADTFAAVFQHIRLFCDHVNLVFDQERLYMQCMDNAHVAIVELDLPAEWFDRYELTSGSVTFGIHAGFLYRILAAREKDQQARRTMTCYAYISRAANPQKMRRLTSISRYH